MQLDVHTLGALMIALLSGIALALAALALSNPRQRAMISSFAGGYGWLALGILGISLRGLVPDFISIIAAGGFVVLGALRFWRGSRLMMGKAPVPHVGAAILATQLAVALYFTYVDPNMSARIIAMSVAVVIAMWFAGYEQWPRVKRGWGPGRLLVGTCSFGTLLFAGRVTVTLVQGAPPDPLHMSQVQAAVFMLLPTVNYVALAFGIIWHVLSRTNGELLAQQIALKNAKEEAERANRTKSDFLANMSHEFRTPLNAIIGFSQVIKDHHMGPVLPIYAEYAGDILTAGEHLLELINNLLDISKIEAGKTELREETVNPATIVADAVAALRDAAAEKDVVLATEIPASIPFLRGDELRLRQVLINLVSNAVKFTEKGRVSVSAGVDELSGFRFTVADTGIGMSADDLLKALEPFGQVENATTKKYTGSGLGLPLAQRLVELHGGRLDIASDKGRGTVIDVYLPANRILPTRRDAAA